MVSHDIITVMTAFWFKKKTEKLAVVFDIGNASVGAALVGISKNNSPKIFYSSRREIKVSKKLTPEGLTLKMTKALQEVAFLIVREGLPHVRFTFFNTLKPVLILFTLSSPWHISQIRTIKKKEDHSFLVERDLMRKLILRELNEFRKMHASHVRNRVEQKYEIIEGDVLDIRLNKYPTYHPIGKVTDELEMTIFASSMLTTTIEKIESLGREIFSGVEIQFATFTFAFFNAVRDIWHEKQNYLLLDISGEISDLSIVKNGVLYDTVSFPFGKNTVVRQVVSELNLSIREAESLLSMYEKKHLGDFEMHRLKKILANAETEWLRLFAKELKNISSNVLFPRDIFLTVDEPLRGWFLSIITRNKLLNVTGAEKSFQVTLFDEKTLAPYCDIGLGVYKDPFLIVESLFLNKKAGVV